MTFREDSKHDDDAEFAQFLNRQGPLAQQLQSLEQPQSPAALDAAILETARRDLADNPRPARSAANDAVMTGASAGRPAFLQRWRMPLGLAASVMVAVLAVVQWRGQGGTEKPLQIALAPQAQTGTADAPADTVASAPLLPVAEADVTARHAPAAERPAQQSPKVAASVAPPLVVAQAETPHAEERGDRTAGQEPTAAAPLVIAQAEPSYQQERMRAMPRASAAHAPEEKPAPATALPPLRDVPLAPVARHPAKPWLELIEEMLKADLRREAREEWKQFRKAYPAYPVPERLEKELNRPQ